MTRLSGRQLTLGYDHYTVSEGLDIEIPDGQFTVIIGPNGCGKSTLLKTLCRLLSPQVGEVVLDGQDLATFDAKTLARELGLLPQSAQCPDGIRVVDLVARGRYPHQSAFRQWGEQDQAAVSEALALTGLESLAERYVDALSGGQRQRAWIAMVLAQQTPILLLDEPTTYLDITHQIELLELFKRLTYQSGRTLIAVLHDLNQACRYADHLIVMANGQVVDTGAPKDIITQDLVEDVFALPNVIIDDPISHTPLIVPKGHGQ